MFWVPQICFAKFWYANLLALSECNNSQRIIETAIRLVFSKGKTVHSRVPEQGNHKGMDVARNLDLALVGITVMPKGPHDAFFWREVSHQKWQQTLGGFPWASLDPHNCDFWLLCFAASPPTQALLEVGKVTNALLAVGLRIQKVRLWAQQRHGVDVLAK